ncbi:hypothetical protein AAG570_002504 [Ranatra chinensis]|uniref:Uncharacterized protein n=1 Tax=Ranatra chinensis TaxID=642074 RepID=A0ABD0Y9T7_9HEMI
MGSKRRNMFYENKKQEMTGIVLTDYTLAHLPSPGRHHPQGSRYTSHPHHTAGYISSPAPSTGIIRSSASQQYTPSNCVCACCASYLITDMSSSAVFENVNNANYEQSLLEKKSHTTRRIFSCAAHKIKKFLGKLKRIHSAKREEQEVEPSDRIIVCRTAEELENAVNEALESGSAFQRVLFLNPADLDICLRGELAYTLYQTPEKQSPY